MRETTSNKLQHTKTAGSQYLHLAQDTASAYAQAAKDRAYAMEESAEACVTEHPTSSVMVAFGLGLGVGITLGAMLADAVRPRRQPVGHFEELGRKVSEYAAGIMPSSWSK